MNYSIIRYVVGWVLKFETAFLCLPAVVGLIYGEDDFKYYFLSAAICLLVGTILTLNKPKNRSLYTREGFIIVALSWFVISLFGAIPFVLTGDIPSYVDALFETISGFTTTGASILTNVEALSYTNLFWRSFTHWIGGMGVFVFMMAIVPLLGGSTMTLMQAESTGPSVDKLVPKIKDTAKILYSIYIVMTLVLVVLLFINGMPLFEAFATSFGTIGTGGFGLKNDSFASYSPTLQNIVTVFMILSGINYSLYFLIIRRKLKQAFAIEEVWWYLAFIFFSAILIFTNTMNIFPSCSEGLRHSFFQVGSIITSTGFATCNYDLWPQLSKNCLLLLMFTGACSGSTGGGIKVSRVIILLKTIKKEISYIAHPQEVRKIHLNGHPVSHEIIRSTNVFMMIYFVILLTSTFVIAVDGHDFTTNFSATVATLSNIGPGFGLVGPSGNFSIFSAFSKLILMFNMLAGRLELLPVLVMFTPTCWRKH